MAKKRIERTDQIFGESEVVTTLFTERESAVQQSIPVDSLVPNRFNPRQNYSREALDELIQSMQEHGFIGALDGRELPDGRVELAYGSRRLLAARAASIQTIPVFLHDWDDDQLRFISLVENLVREDLTSHEQAETIGQMHEELGFSVREITRRTGKPKSWVEDRLALYRAPQDVKEMVAIRSDALRAANYIARVLDEASRRVLEEKVIAEELTTRQVQQAVQQIIEEVPIEEAMSSVTTEETREPPPIPPPQVSARADTEELAARHVPLTVQPIVEEGGLTEEVTSVAASERGLTPPAHWPEVRPEPPVQPAGMEGLDTLHTRPEEKGVERIEEVVSRSVRERPSASRFLIRAYEALARFNPEAVQDEELSELHDHLQQLVTRANWLLEKVETRLQAMS